MTPSEILIPEYIRTTCPDCGTNGKMRTHKTEEDPAIAYYRCQRNSCEGEVKLTIGNLE